MSSESAPKTIELYGVNVQHEAKAGGAITPGHFVERTSTGTVQVTATSGAVKNTHVAVEARDIGNGIDDDYASGDNVYFVTAQPGSAVYAIAGEAITAGALLTVDGSGRVIDTLTAGNVVVAQALEAASAADDRIRVEIINAYSQPAA